MPTMLLDSAEFRGDNLRLARHYRGFTLADVADRIHVQRQYVHQLENGSRRPARDLLEALACALQFRTGFFLQPIPNHVKGDECHFRKLKSFRKYLEERVVAHATLFLIVLDYLDVKLGLPKFNVPGITASLDSEVERAAEACRVHWKLPKNAPIKNVVRILESAGVPITSLSGISERVDAFSWHRDKKRSIVVRSTDKECWSRSRLDLAHELGHLVMHQNVQPGLDSSEDQAFRFAAAFLLPREAFVQEFPRSQGLDWPRLFKLKARWGVSVAAIVRRAYDLNIIDATRYRWANITIHQKGWDKGEEGELTLEAPEMVAHGFRALCTIYKLSPQDVATQLNVSASDLGIITGINVPSLTKT